MFAAYSFHGIPLSIKGLVECVEQGDRQRLNFELPGDVIHSTESYIVVPPGFR
ncbi:MAG: hypothetical protein U0790_28095 [Isosphaeraceae bacterium]